MFGFGNMSRIFLEIGLIMLAGIWLFGNASRPVPLAAPVNGL
jgi:hypothetical protein